MIALHLPFVHRVKKNGRAYFYYRRPGVPSVRLPGDPGSREFMEAYQAAHGQTPTLPGSDRATPGSMRALASAWYLSSAFTRLKPQSQRTYRRLLDAYLIGRETRPVAQLEPRHILAVLDRMSGTPAQANALLNVLRRLFQFAFERGWRKDNPTRDIKRLRYDKKPYATWTEADIATFEKRWPLGTRARLALALLLYTGQRRSDVVRMGPQHVRDGSVEVVQRKTGTRLSIPLHQQLRAAIAEHEGGHLAFLVTQAGVPFTPTGFYNWFTDCAVKAGLRTGLAPHGLRKAAARRLAEAGCTPHQIAAITGHQTLAEVERYTKEANQKRLAKVAVTKLGPRPRGKT